VDKFPSRERTSAVSVEPRVSAIVVVRNLRARQPGQAPLDLCLRSVLAEPMIDDVVIVDQRNGPDVSASLRALQADRRDVRVIQAPPSVSRSQRRAAARRGRAHGDGRR
jgi:hypothetical protein